MNVDKRLMVTGALVATFVIGAAGGTMLNALQARAADTPTPSTSQNQQTLPPKQDGQFDPKKGGHVGSNGFREELLTGDTAEKVKTAAQKAVPGATVDRVETDAEGSPYEAHMTKSDGSRITVKLDKSFNVTTTETGQNKM